MANSSNPMRRRGFRWRQRFISEQVVLVMLTVVGVVVRQPSSADATTPV
jgi:hypothetical protein